MRVETAVRKFWARVVGGEGDECWLWGGHQGWDGYGQVWWQGKKRRAHRCAWELTFGAVPEGLFVCHRCDVPLCVRPSHLWLGTAADNSRDAKAKGRMASGDRHRHLGSRLRGDRHPLRVHPERAARGEAVGGARLTADGVRAIRCSQEPSSVLARRFGVAHGTIRGVRTGETWRHVVP